MLVSIYGGSAYAGLLFFVYIVAKKLKEVNAQTRKNHVRYIYIAKICGIIYLQKEKKYAYRGKSAEF